MTIIGYSNIESVNPYHAETSATEDRLPCGHPRCALIQDMDADGVLGTAYCWMCEREAQAAAYTGKDTPDGWIEFQP